MDVERGFLIIIIVIVILLVVVDIAMYIDTH